MKKLLILAAGVAGYVLGSRAGRERYDQIRDQTQKVWNSPTVQSGVDHATDAAKQAASAAGTAAAGAASNAASAAGAKVAEVVKGSDDDTSDEPSDATPSATADDAPTAGLSDDLAARDGIVAEAPPVPPSPAVTTPPPAGDLAAESEEAERR